MERLFSQKNRIVVEFEVEEDSGQVQEEVRMVRGQVEGFTETLNSLLGVALDAPEVANLVEDGDGLGVLI